MEPKLWINKIKFSDNSIIHFDNDDIVVLVGPNNAGKSATLKEASNYLISPKTPKKVVKSISFSKIGTSSDVINFVESISIKEYRSNPEPYYSGLGYGIYKPHIENWWDDIDNGISGLASVFVKYLHCCDQSYQL
ncbi:MAG TPA: hypothetical protein VGQ04_12910 [Chitinophagaceae bacterium]|jgi:energy-coupling factor transporter ATP-binding protein EcfA2|nr:hypothetical protein [Chitinophagaceae bacterium]